MRSDARQRPRAQEHEEPMRVWGPEDSSASEEPKWLQQMHASRERKELKQPRELEERSGLAELQAPMEPCSSSSRLP